MGTIDLQRYIQNIIGTTTSLTITGRKKGGITMARVMK